LRLKGSIVIACAVLFFFIGLGIAVLRQGGWTEKKEAAVSKGAEAGPGLDKLRAENERLRKKLASSGPKGIYLVVDTAKNVLYMKKGDKVLLTAVVSSGSGNVLQEPGGERKWVFDTPRGEFSITSKVEHPDWIRPDWAFIEEGKDIPGNWKDRVESGVLGDYAMGFGNGYFIHGTLYTRLLGRNVTHGCIRVADKELEQVFRTVGIGTKLYII